MEYLIRHEDPTLNSPYLIAAFGGWPDAGDVATGAVRYLITKLKATRFAEIPPEEFFVFTVQRPISTTVNPPQRIITWPSNDFFYWKNPDQGHDLILLIGIEPNLKWRAFTQTVADVLREHNVSRIVTLGGTYESLPHTADIQVSGSTNDPGWQKRMEELEIQFTGYQGPTSIHSPLTEECYRRGILGGSIWGHAPHYVQVSPNIKVACGMLEKVSALLGIPFDLDEARAAAVALDRKVERALARDPELRAYVAKLQEVYSQETGFMEQQPSAEPLNAEAIVQDLEEFLRQQRKNDLRRE